MGILNIISLFFLINAAELKYILIEIDGVQRGRKSTLDSKNNNAGESESEAGADYANYWGYTGICFVSNTTSQLHLVTIFSPYFNYLAIY